MAVTLARAQPGRPGARAHTPCSQIGTLMHLRDFTTHDYDALLALTIDVFEPFWERSLRPAVGDVVFTAQDGNWAEDYRTHLHHIHEPAAGRFSLVAEDDDGEVAGYVAFVVNQDKPTAEIDILAVRAGHRQARVATRLCEQAFDQMRAHGCAAVWLGTGGDDFHAPARRFYESLDMTPFPNVLYFRAL